MEKTYKRMPFDIELAKKIQSGEIEGRIVTNHDVVVTLLDAEYMFGGEYHIPVIWHWETGHNELVLYNNKGECKNSHRICYLHIELPEEAPNLESASKYIEKQIENASAYREMCKKKNIYDCCIFTIVMLLTVIATSFWGYYNVSTITSIWMAILFGIGCGAVAFMLYLIFYISPNL